MKKILLDPGHGGKDPGAAAHGIQEKDIVLSIAKRTKKILENQYEGAEVLLTREDDTFLELRERTDIANKWGAEVYVSIHINAAAAAAANGFETFVYNGGVPAATQALQNTLHSHILKYMPHFDDRGKKQANFHVLRETNMHAVLTECGFISNAKDAALLKDDFNIRKLAHGHAAGIASFVGLKEKQQPQQPQKLYRVQVGAFSVKENAEKMQKQLVKEGYKDAFIVSD